MVDVAMSEDVKIGIKELVASRMKHTRVHAGFVRQRKKMSRRTTVGQAVELIKSWATRSMVLLPTRSSTNGVWHQRSDTRVRSNVLGSSP